MTDWLPEGGRFGVGVTRTDPAVTVVIHYKALEYKFTLTREEATSASKVLELAMEMVRVIEQQESDND